MQKATEDNILLLRLDHDEDIISSLNMAISEKKGTLMIVAALGMMHKFEIGYFDEGKYIKKKIEEPVELLTMSGSVSSQGENRIHIHVSLADRDHNSIGGHLFSGKVWMSEEILLLRLPNIISERIIDPMKRVGVLQLLSNRD